jgi:hypothetical protein
MQHFILFALISFVMPIYAQANMANAMTCRLAQDNEVLHDIQLVVRSHQSSLERPKLSVVGQFILRDATDAQSFAFVGDSKYSMNKNIVSVKSRSFISPKPRWHKLKLNLKQKTATFKFKQWPKNIGLGKSELKFKAKLFCQEI